MTDNMQRARELLAAECRAEKMGSVATAIEQGMHVSGFVDISLRAIAAALRQAAVPAAEAVAWISVDDHLPTEADYGEHEEVLVRYRYIDAPGREWTVGKSYHDAERSEADIIGGIVALLKGVAVLGLECNHNGRPARDIIGDLIAAETADEFVAALHAGQEVGRG